MSLILPKTCSMGGSKTGLVGTIGITLLNPDGTIHTARATANIYEIGGGCYGKNVTFPDDWKGSLKWDTGGGSPVYASEDYEMEGLIQEIRTQTDKMHFTGDDIKATLDNEKVALTDTTEAQIDNLEKIEQGRWKITGNQLIFYDTNGATPLHTFNLKDKDGNPTETNITERTPI